MAGLYLHVPFCSQRCVYCDFYFVTTRTSHAPFVQALRTELDYYASKYGRREPIETIYFGGGTPSLLALDDVAQILQAIYDGYDTSAVEETTFEVNPEDAGLDYLRGLRGLGVDRLSIGVQSFFADDLHFMNRSHTAEEAEAVVGRAREAGFDNFSVDLIFGLPEQPEEYWAANLQKVIRLDVPHLSTYSLTIEEKTPLAKQVQRGIVVPAPDEAMEARYAFTMDYLQRHGYEHYEISSFARPGRRARHNGLYWRHANYLGFGPSAHSFWKGGLTASSALRWSNVRNLKRYEALLAGRQAPLEAKERLDLDDLANEHLLLALRTSDGIDLAHLETRYGVDLLFEKPDELAELEREGFIEPIRGGRVRLTRRGKLLCDVVTERLLLDD